MFCREEGDFEIVAIGAGIGDTKHCIVLRGDDHGVARGKFITIRSDGRHRRIAEGDGIGLVSIGLAIIHPVGGS